MKLNFLELCGKINTPATSLFRRGQSGAAAPYRLFIKGFLGCNSTMLPGICEKKGGQA